MKDLEVAVGVVVISFYFVLLGFAQWWIYHDAERRGKPPWRVFWVSIFLWPLGHLCWWAFRPDVIHDSGDVSEPDSSRRHFVSSHGKQGIPGAP